MHGLADEPPDRRREEANVAVQRGYWTVDSEDHPFSARHTRWNWIGNFWGRFDSFRDHHADMLRRQLAARRVWSSRQWGERRR